NMSGIGECAIVYIPTIVATVRPAATPAEAPKSLRPSQYVRSTTPIAARRDGKTAVRALTCPSDHEASAISHAASGGFTICGLPSGMAGASPGPLGGAVRARSGELGCSVWVNRTQSKIVMGAGATGDKT